MALINRVATLLAIVAALSARTFAQEHERSEPAGGPFSPTTVLDAPFSAEAITKVRETLSNGTVRERIVTAHYYRDSRGRVRAELATPWGPYVMLAIPDTPNVTNGVGFYRLDSGTRTYRIASHLIAAHPKSRRVFPNRPVDTSENLRRYQRHHRCDPRCPCRWLRGGRVVHRISVVRDTYDCKSINVAWA